MKRNISAFLLILLILVSSVNVYANPIDNTLIQTGYTEDGLPYQVYGTILSISANSVTVTRTIVYEGYIIPESSLFWTEVIDNEKYTGTLYLFNMSYDKSKNETTATYQGTLTK